MPNDNSPSSSAELTPEYKSPAKDSSDYEGTQLPQVYIAIIALIQGIALAYLYQSIEHEMWPSTDLPWLTALVTFFVSFPSLFLLIASKHDYKSIFNSLLIFCLLISALGAYVGIQQSAFMNNNSTFFVFTFAVLIACFKAIMYIKLLANKQDIHYQSLFLASWRNAIIFAVTVLFMSIFFGILHLGASLFDLLGITFFTQLLQEEWFWVPALTLASAFAIHIFRKISYLADNISTILQTLVKFLLPVLVFISLGFLITLPFTGLEKLWETRSGSLLLLWLMALSLFFVNAIYHKGNDNKPYHIAMHRYIILGVAVLPVYSVISAYGIFSRVSQYGFTPDRLWAISIWLLLSCFVAGYLFGIVKLRDQWLKIQSKVNVIMGLFVLAFVLLVHSPALNFKAMSTDSQMARYYDGDVSAEDLDISFIIRQLGKPGYIAMQQLITEIESTHPKIVATINKQYRNLKERTEKINKGDFLGEEKVKISYWPNENAFNPELISFLNEQENHNRWNTEEHRVAIDLNDDDVLELLTIMVRSNHVYGKIWFKSDAAWKGSRIEIDVPENDDLEYSLQNSEIELLEPEYKIIAIDGIKIDVNNLN